MKKLIGFPKGLRKQFENVIPDHWDYKDLVKIATVEYGISDPLDRSITSGIPLLSMPNISKEGFLTNAQIPFIEEANVKESELLHKNDILFNWRNGSPEHLGKTFLFLLDGKYTHVGFLLRIRMLDNQVNPIYINEYIRYIKERGFFLRAKIQVNNTFNKEELEGLPVILPTIKEQEKIGIILNGYNDIIIYMEKLLVQKLLYKKILVQQLLSGKKRFKEFKKSKWQLIHLGEIFSERNERNENSIHYELLSVTNDRGIVKRHEVDKIDSSSEDKSNYKIIRKGDIGYNTMRMWQGVSAVSQYEGIVSPAYTVVVPTDSIDVNYFGYLFKYPPIVNLFYRYSQGLVEDTLNCKYDSFSQIKVTIPTDKEEQQKIASTLLSVDKGIELLKTKLELLKQQKKGLMQKLLTGKIRVKVN